MSLATLITRSHAEKENWRYTDLEKIIKTSFTLKSAANGYGWHQAVASLDLRNDEACRLTFVNGVWQDDASLFGAVPRSVLQTNDAQSYCLSFAEQTCLVTTPIELVFVTDGTVAETNTKLTISIGASASLTITEHHVTVAGAATAQVLNTFIQLGKQAKLEHNKILHDNAQSAHLAQTNILVGEGAYYRNFALIKDTRLVRNELDVTLQDRLAQCALNGVMLLRDQEHADTFTRTTHAAPHGTSRQLYKTVIKDRAQGAFQGKIIVAKDAQKTDGRQLSRALLLSDQAEMNAKPELEIYADDVSCSHGSTVGDIDEDALFYLRTRGLDPAAARALLLRAFINEAIDEAHEGNEQNNTIRAAAGRWLDVQ